MRPLSLTRKLMTLLPLLFLLGSGLLLFFLILSGASSSSSFLRKFYWLRAETPQLGDYDETLWTNYRLCSLTSDSCGSATAGLPISPRDNFGSNASIPSGFNSSRNSYYYESRIGWLFLLIACFFVIVAILLSLPLLCVSSSLVITIVTAFTMLGFVFIAVSALLYTHILTKAKRQFNNNGQSASIGTKMMALIWTTTLLLLLSSLITMLLSCCQFTINRYDSHKEKETVYSSDEDTYNDAYIPKTSQDGDVNNTTTKQKKSFWSKSSNQTESKPLESGVVTTAGANPVPPTIPEQTTTNPQSNKINFFRVRNKRSETDDYNSNGLSTDDEPYVNSNTLV